MRLRPVGPMVLILGAGATLLALAGLIPELMAGPQRLAAGPGAAEAGTAEAGKAEAGKVETGAAEAGAAKAGSPEPTARPRSYPRLSLDPAQLAGEWERVQTALRDPATPAADLPELGHREQVIVRVLARQATLAQRVRLNLNGRWRSHLDRHLAARREFVAMQGGRPGLAVLPAWRIIAPEPPERLLSHYRKAQAATGIPWEVLAAINLVESGMGRIDGISVANARGPMQFLPTTWAQAGIGKGDIRDPHDAIQAAARYLVRRGGPGNLSRALWGYNNSDHYVRGVLAYADLIRADPTAFTGLYHWEVHVMSSAGDLWLPVGYEQRQRIPVNAYLRKVPASAPPRELAGG